MLAGAGIGVIAVVITTEDQSSTSTSNNTSSPALSTTTTAMPAPAVTTSIALQGLAIEKASRKKMKPNDIHEHKSMRATGEMSIYVLANVEEDEE
ncbi:Hypothetical predicted protein [Octopus vulgaris]|uniref:Uncharacterized protein n=1 Tax=Octopus vulgaris TaxID=6645 RepID=A0AA36AS41_OCTVU|nr:Hypothetical predicted protein [Octopus vulgaris]